MGKDEAELVPMNKEPGYGGTDAEESKKPDIDISDFKPAAPTWVLDGSLRAKEQKKFEALIESASSKAPEERDPNRSRPGGAKRHARQDKTTRHTSPMLKWNLTHIEVGISFLEAELDPY